MLSAFILTFFRLSEFKIFLILIVMIYFLCYNLVDHFYRIGYTLSDKFTFDKSNLLVRDLKLDKDENGEV